MEAIVTQLRDHGKVEHGFMGISMTNLDEAAHKQLGVDGAITACRQNLWFGVLNAIQNQHLRRRVGR